MYAFTFLFVYYLFTVQPHNYVSISYMRDEVISVLSLLFVFMSLCYHPKALVCDKSIYTSSE
jgi:hypothetical protein